MAEAQLVEAVEVLLLELVAAEEVTQPTAINQTQLLLHQLSKMIAKSVN